MGADNIENFDKWREYEEILRDYPLLVYPRDGYSVEKFADKIKFLENAPLFDFAATDIRTMIANGEDIRNMLNAEVVHYIIQNKLYR